MVKVVETVALADAERLRDAERLVDWDSECDEDRETESESDELVERLAEILALMETVTETEWVRLAVPVCVCDTDGVLDVVHDGVPRDTV